MKLLLTDEQQEKLEELGVETSSLTHLLSILPKWIKYRHELLWLKIKVDLYTEHWYCEYESQDGFRDADTFQSAAELIDALYSLLVYCIEEKLITPN